MTHIKGIKESRLLTLFLISLGIFSLSLPAFSREVPQNKVGTIKGGINVSRACRDKYGENSIAKIDNSRDVYNWRCEYTDAGGQGDKRDGVDMDEACRKQYANNTESGYLRNNDAYSWVCYIK
jgi:hypothetical protein